MDAIVIYRSAIASVLPLLFAGFGAWAGVATGGIITGKVTDSITGDSIFGARVTDVTDAANEIPGSFAGDGVYFILDVPEGTRFVKVTAEGYKDLPPFQVEVDVDPPAVFDFPLEPDISLNTAEIRLLLDSPNGPDEPPFLLLLTPFVEALQDGVVVGRTFVRTRGIYRISGLRDGKTTFRAISPFYLVGEEIVELSG
ncbi:MAG: carboxypeptidase regulatory-like domain-containing protein, partial [Candidatus Hydrogenedentes bacterium]|nr:carboxypeptidase regulatory-like domain-containing protein [Candidatus Hydrogenedentota bacterium]